MVFCVLQLLVLWCFVVVCFDLVFWFATVFVLFGWLESLFGWGLGLLFCCWLLRFCVVVVVYIVRLVF